ncbi:LOW QUALITY PROTEIN: hypothetical protein PHMEG_0002224 [Phytophthora megakarya]|uniref:Uncharacterized protein n=1 Tax=Phytophthora megakarya TaxID=4795 RepID=A0A225WZC2_9STRA|nr:LOW QUALITY PROTEIN: hypothetical protein PHMEG_0002224 [Phytophthora megakarya]
MQLPSTPYRVKGVYYPPQPHLLAAHRLFDDLNGEEVREFACVRFDAPIAIVMAPFTKSGRLALREQTELHFRPPSELEQLQRGSSNANFSSDFGAAGALPASDSRCTSCEDLLVSIGGLISVSGALRYDHARPLHSQVKRSFSSIRRVYPKHPSEPSSQ